MKTTIKNVIVILILMNTINIFSQKRKQDIVYEVSGRSCWKQPKQVRKGNPISIKITQAVYNSANKKLDISFDTPYHQNVEVYAVNSRKGLVQRTMFTINPDSDNKSVQSMDLPSKWWVNDLKPTDNVYVMIKTSLIDGNEAATFEAEAVPVLIRQN